jgi:hypothetical protein
VELLAMNDVVYARDESDTKGPLTPQRIEEVFVRLGRIFHVHVGDGRVLRTTPAHPFHVLDKGWLPAGQLQIGDLLRCDHDWVPVTDLLDTGD